MLVAGFRLPRCLHESDLRRGAVRFSMKGFQGGGGSDGMSVVSDDEVMT